MFEGQSPSKTPYTYIGGLASLRLSFSIFLLERERGVKPLSYLCTPPSLIKGRGLGG